MSSITKAQFEKWSAKLQNGFILDYRFFCIWGEKRVRKQIMLDDETMVECSISTDKATTNWKGETVQPVKTVVEISEWHKTKTELWSNCNGTLFRLDIPHPESKTAKYSFTEAETAKWPEDIIMSIYREKLKKQEGKPEVFEVAGM